MNTGAQHFLYYPKTTAVTTTFTTTLEKSICEGTKEEPQYPTVSHIAGLSQFRSSAILSLQQLLLQGKSSGFQSETKCCLSISDLSIFCRVYGTKRLRIEFESLVHGVIVEQGRSHGMLLQSLGWLVVWLMTITHNAGELGVLIITPKTANIHHEADEVYEEVSTISCVEEFLPLPTERSFYAESVSSPMEKLSQAQMMAANLIKENEVILANNELIRCVALTKIIHGDGHWRLAKAFANLAHGYLTLRALPAQAKQHSESAKNILLRGVDVTKSVEDKREILETLITIYYTLGMAHLLQNNGREAFLNLQKVEKIVEELQELNERQVVTSKISEKDIAIALGKACLLQNKLSLASNYFEQAIDFVISSDGDSAPEMINIYQELAKTMQLKKNHDHAIEHLLQAHSIAEKKYKNVSVEAAQTGLLLAKAYATSGKYEYHDEADKYFKESLGIYQTVLGPDDSQTLSTCVEYSKWLIQIGDKEEAYTQLHRAVSSETEFNEIVAEIFSIMGSICLSDGKILKGCQLLKKCLEIQSAVYGSQHSKTKGTQNILHKLQKSGAAAENTTTFK
ncbi:tetratricopeptide repeat protein 23-like [Bombina bombina]|uniref:tetratricopeptide repeat protein 23-like n=1 Tax=Bombina bombina TaxID=8345 RepID=UPI00235AB928|nr:tetratricopeptide repeat protein 23-like [Bombina bombina]